MFKVYDYLCEPCKRKLLDRLSNGDEIIKCGKCGQPMTRLFPCPKGGEQRGKFKPFWSDTFDMRVNDREDLKKIKELRKQHGLECVGHTTQKADNRAIRHNYESE